MIAHVVTSCSLAGWHKYGEAFVATFDKFWPQDVKLHVVSEDTLPVPASNRMINLWGLGQSGYWQDFRAEYEHALWVHGDSAAARPIVVKRWRETTGYNFRFDAYKFSKKVFAIDLVADSLTSGRLFWIDADVKTFASVPSTLITHVLPDWYALSCLMRPGYHSECGFIGYNLDVSGSRHFIKSFAKLYMSGEVFDLPEWHDSWAFDWLRNKLMTRTYPIGHKSKGHPFINSELGRYMDHLKGKRKDHGRSGAVEQIAHKGIPYWNDPRRV